MYDAQSLLGNTLYSLELSPQLETEGFHSGNCSLVPRFSFMPARLTTYTLTPANY